jgi:hypothetical protein
MQAAGGPFNRESLRQRHSRSCAVDLFGSRSLPTRLGASGNQEDPWTDMATGHY